METVSQKETQRMIDSIVPDQYSAIGKLHQIGFTFEGLKKNCTEAVDFFSNFDDEEHVPFLTAVQESLDAIGIMEEALADTKTILKWMRARRAEIFNDNNDE